MNPISRVLKPILFFVLVFVMTAIASRGAGAAPAGQPLPLQPFAPALFSEGEVAAGRAQNDGKSQIVRARQARLDLALLGGPRGDEDRNTRITLNLFEDVTLTAIFEREEAISGNGFGWVGRVAESDLGSAIFVVREGLVVGTVKLPGASYQVRPLAGGEVLIREVDESAYPEPLDDTVEVEPPATVSLAPEQALDDGSMIDVLVVYTPAAMNAAGGQAAIEALIELGIVETNDSYANSGITQRVRLVHQAESAYTESADSGTDLTRLAGSADGYMDEIHGLRDTFGADVVSLWLELAGSACGRGYVMTVVGSYFEEYAFNVTDYSCATGYYSFGHEMGHNMGMRHDWYVDGTANSPYSYNHGYTYAAGSWRTVMAYNDNCAAQGGNCTRIAYWSNPAILASGIPMGVAAGTATNCTTGVANPGCDADNHLGLDNTAYTVANFRQSVVLATLSKSVSATYVEIDDPITYTLSADNLSATTTTAVVLTDTVPANTRLDPTSLSADAGYSGTTAGSVITWTTNQDLAQGESLQRTFRVVAELGGLVSNTAYLTNASNSLVVPSNKVETIVGDKALCGFTEGFEVGQFSEYWQTHATSTGRARVLSDLPNTGLYSAVMDSSMAGSYAESGLILSPNLAGATTADLDFYWHDLADEYHPDLDGVFIREEKDGTWVKVYDFSGANNSSFQAGHIDLETAAANHGLSLTRDFQVKFQGYDNWYFIPTNIIGGDGYALDDLQLACSCNAAPAGPQASISAAGSEASLSWGDASDVALYEVWRSSSPYFSPGSPGAELIGERMQTGFSDSSVLGDGSASYYLVRAANACGDMSAVSNGVAEFEFGIEPGG